MSTAALRGRWQALTREGRDTLWLLGMLALVMAPHAARLPWWASVGAAAALLWRARLAWVDGKLPPRWLMVTCLVAAVALTWLTHGTLLGRGPGVTLVVVLATLKCLELRARRDSLVCLYLGFFLILTQFLYGQGVGTAVLMLVGVWGLLTALILGQRPLGRPRLADVGREALRAMLWGLPLMVVLFVLFPRFGPLWALPNDTAARTGLSDRLSLGQYAELAQDDSIALRVQFLGRVPPAAQLYFRSLTLDRFDGRTWTPDFIRLDEREEIPAGRPGVRYEMTVEPSPLPVLPLLDHTVQAESTPASPPLVVQRRGPDWFQRGGVNRRVQVQATAWPNLRTQTANSTALQRLVRLPSGVNPGTRAWALRLQQRPDLAGASPRALSAAVLAHIRRENFVYTLTPGLPEDADSPHLIDDFWLNSRLGFCEHFATAYVVVMRSMGVPARVVTGYQGAEPNPLDGQYIVRNSNAHAWAEIWDAAVGWVRVDPTAAVAPERVEQPPPRPRPFAGLPGPLGEFDPDSLRELRALWESVDHRWNVWVLQYSRGQQLELLRAMGWARPDWEDLGRLLGWALAALGLGSSLIVWMTRERHAASPWQRPLMRVHNALASLGLGQPGGPAPAAASAWLALLSLQWGTATNARQRALLHALNQLDALRYAPLSASQRPADTHRALAALARHVQSTSEALRQAEAHSPSPTQP